MVYLQQRTGTGMQAFSDWKPNIKNIICNNAGSDEYFVQKIWVDVLTPKIYARFCFAVGHLPGQSPGRT